MCIFGYQLILHFFIITSLLVIIKYACTYLWKRWTWYNAVQKFIGPPAYPVIGNAYVFICKNEDILMKIYTITKQYSPGPVRFWLGPELLIVLPNPDHVEKILRSTNVIRKHEIYRFPQVFLGNGLITGSGPAVKQHRRIIQPMIDANFSKEATYFMQHHISLCMEKLEDYEGKGNFDFFQVVHPCMADIIKEIILGSSDRSQKNGTSQFDQAMLDAYDLAFIRMVKPWQHLDFLFNITPLKRRQDEIRNIIRSKGKMMMQDAFKRSLLSRVTDNFYPIIDRIAAHILENPGSMDNEAFIDNILTLYTASEDTLSIISCFLAICFGMETSCQEKASEEIRNIFGESPRPIETEDLPKMQYIEMCIKETLRLFPIAPIILRKSTEDLDLGEWVIPKDCAITIPIFNLHRDPKFWKKPDEFYPEHFLSEAENARHIYSYLPFSAGPRGCIGKMLAYTGLKIFMANLLQRFEVEADGTVSTMKIKMDISTRPTDGCYLRLKKRVWK